MHVLPIGVIAAQEELATQAGAQTPSVFVPFTTVVLQLLARAVHVLPLQIVEAAPQLITEHVGGGGGAPRQFVL